jgi:hypothetical protein
MYVLDDRQRFQVEGIGCLEITLQLGSVAEA